MVVTPSCPAMDRAPPHARLVVRRHLAHEPTVAFAWLTDFEEGDVERAQGHVVAARRVVKREGDRITLEGMLEVAGRPIPGHAIVDLAPPGRWHAKLYDRKDRLVTFNDYRVEPDGQGGSWLTVDYHFVLPKWKHRLRYHLGGRSVLRRELGRMWDGFQGAMARELAPPYATTDAPRSAPSS